MTDLPEVARLAEEVARTGRPRLLQRGDETLAELRPVKPRHRRPKHSDEPPTDEVNDSLLNLSGLFDSGSPGDVSENKYKYLAEAYYPKAEPSGQ